MENWQLAVVLFCAISTVLNVVDFVQRRKARREHAERLRRLVAEADAAILAWRVQFAATGA